MHPVPTEGPDPKLWTYRADSASPWWELEVTTREVSAIISIEPRPAYCDRGNFIAKCSGYRWVGENKRGINLLDDQDGWPRYYFSFPVAIAECEAWLRKRRLLQV